MGKRQERCLDTVVTPDDIRILYVASYDLSLSKAHCINEYGFVLALQRRVGDRMYGVVPRPSRAIPSLLPRLFSYSVNHRNHHPFFFVLHVISQIFLMELAFSRRPFDLLVVRLDAMPLVAFWAAFRDVIPVAVKSPGLAILTAFQSWWGPVGKVASWVNRGMIKYVARKAITVDVATEPYRDLYIREANSNRASTVVIDNGVDVNRFRPMPSREARESLGIKGLDPIVGLVAGRPLEQGARQLIELLPMLQSNYPTVGGLIVGGAESMADITAYCAKHDVLDRCVVLGRVDHEMIPMCVNAIDVALSLDSVFDGARFGSAGMKVREYVACGVPIVSGPGDRLIERNPEFGSVVAVDDIETLHEVVLRWLHAPWKRAQLREGSTQVGRELLSHDGRLEERFGVWCGALCQSSDLT